MTARILVVDDEPDVEVLLSQRFRSQVRSGEFEFLFAYDGQHALQVLEEEPGVTMVLSDINMPRMDGLVLLDRLRARHGDLATVIVSAYGDMANIRTAMNRGAFDFVTKPIEFEDLETTIRKTLDHIQTFRQMDEQRKEAVRAHATLSRYFSPNVAAALARIPDCLSPGGERRTATFMFTDLADFTALVETSPSNVIVALLNEYLDHVTEIVFQHQGTVMKLIGDSVHAIFGAPLEAPNHARHAVACALAIDAFAEDYKARKRSDGIPLGLTRIGINTGPAIIGNFGGTHFFDYTAYGDAVNVAARLESANKPLGTRICVSQSVVDEIPDFKGRPAGRLALKGKADSLQTYEPLTDERDASPGMAAYRAAYAKLETGDAGVRQAFAALVGQYEDDPLALFHLGRLLAGMTGVEIALKAN